MQQLTNILQEYITHRRQNYFRMCGNLLQPTDQLWFNPRVQVEWGNSGSKDVK